MQNTAIDWTEKRWNFLRGCTRVSEGCRHCYAERTAARFATPGNPYEGIAEFVKTDAGQEARWTNKVVVVEKELDAPLRSRKPALVFVNTMSDTFHADVPDEIIIQAFDVMRQASCHQFQLLTKRPERVLEMCVAGLLEWSPNIWMGTSVEDNLTVDRLTHLQQVRAEIKWVSVEPLLEDIADSLELHLSWLDWVVVGGESGPRARPMKSEWASSIWADCLRTDVPFFFKQMGGRTDKGQRELVNENGDKFPRQREYPIDIERFHKTKGQMVEQLRIL